MRINKATTQYSLSVIQENDATAFVEFMLEVIWKLLKRLKVQRSNRKRKSANYVILPSLKPKSAGSLNNQGLFRTVRQYRQPAGTRPHWAPVPAAVRPLFIIPSWKLGYYVNPRHKRKVIHITLERKSALFLFCVFKVKSF